MYADAIGREEEWLERSHPEPDEFQSHYEADLGNGKWHSVSMHPTDLGGFVVTRADISERKKAEAAEREATALLQKVLDACPVADPHVDDRRRNALSQSGQQGSSTAIAPQLVDYYVDPDDRDRLHRALAARTAASTISACGSTTPTTASSGVPFPRA